MASSLVSGDRKSCGCQRKIDIEGLRSGRLVAIKNTNKKDNRGNYLWECKCDCGNTINVAAAYLTSQKTQSCGCVREEKSHIPKFRTDYTGQTFNYLIVLRKLDEKAYPGEYYYECKCDCGNIIKTTSSMLLSGDRTSCGCKRREDLIGQKFGRWTVLEYVGDKKHRCKCDCGKEKIIPTSRLKNGRSKSCGCLFRELSSQLHGKNIHGYKSGKLTAVKLLKNRSKGKKKERLWLCRCECGKYSRVRTSDITSNSVQSCGNCGSYVRGIRVSKPQLELHRLLGRGVLNFKTRCGLRPDIAFVHNGEKIAIEYDEEHWHDEKEDEIKTKRLLEDGWKVIRILVSNKMPNQKFLDFINKGLGLEHKCCLTTI
jgi:hypothetical protein